MLPAIVEKFHVLVVQFAAAFALLLLMQLGFVPSGVTKALDSMISEHGRIVHKLEVMCVHQAKDDRERRECLE